jgi:hypothetical protein
LEKKGFQCEKRFLRNEVVERNEKKTMGGEHGGKNGRNKEGGCYHKNHLNKIISINFNFTTSLLKNLFFLHESVSILKIEF